MTRTPTLTQALELLNLYNVHQLHAELTALQPGQPRARHYDADRTTTGQGPADPTYTAATTPNQAAADLAAYHRHIDQLYAACMGLANLADRHVPTHEPPRARLQSLANQGEEGCHYLATIGHWAPVHTRTDFGTVLAQALPEPRPVSDWVYRFTRRYGRLPTKREMRIHVKGGRVFVKEAS